VKGKDYRIFNLARDHCQHLFVLIGFRCNKISCTTTDLFVPSLSYKLL